MCNADMAQWSTQQPKTLSLIGCEFESHYPHMKKSIYKISDNLYQCECGMNI